MKRFSWVFVLLFFLLVGCESMFENISGKSYNADFGGIGGVFSTSVDMTSGTPTFSPKAEMGDFSANVMSHKVGDGDMVYYRKDKSFWGSEIGSVVFKFNGKDSLQNFSIKDIPAGTIEINVTGKSVATNTIVEPMTASYFKAYTDNKLNQHSKDFLAKMSEDLQKIRSVPITDTLTRLRWQELASMSDSVLYSLIASDNTKDNRLIGDEILWRELQRKIVN